jgi:hypothetical protein
MVLIAAPMASSSGGSGITLLLPLILIIGMIWFMSRSHASSGNGRPRPSRRWCRAPG